MKKVLAINSSRRKQNTYNLLTQIKEILEKQDIEVEIISLYDYEIKDCIGCERCVLKDNCVLKDDTELVKEKMLAADGIILSSPVYLRQVSGKLKTFVDRTCSWFHRPPLCAKPILAVATTKGSGLKSTLNYIDELTEQWGAMSAGQIGTTIRTENEKIQSKQLDNFVKLLNHPEKFSPSFANLMNFQVQKALSAHLLETDRIYWDKMNWRNKSYYFDCKISFFKKLIPTMVGKKITKAMSKSEAIIDK
ncbi:MAG: flavodoxin family protein [Clostridia bacterium]